MSKKNKLPKIKKEIKQFLKNEEGKITKEEIVNLGTTIAAISFFVSGNMSESHNSYVKKQESNIPEEGTLLASSDDSQLLAHDSEYVDDCHDSHSSCSHDSCHSQHSSCHSQHSSCHSQHSSCHSNHSSCHSNHSSCHSSCGSCCPFIILWNGEKYVLENNILPQSEDSERDNLIVEDLYKFENKPVPEDGFYKIRISEFEKERSYFKDFELIKVSHPEDVEVGVIDNEIVAYKDIVKPDKFLVKGDEVSLDEVVKKEKGESASLIFNEIDKDNNLLVMRGGLRGGKRRVEKAEEILKENNESVDLFAVKATVALGLLSAPRSAYAAAMDKCGQASLVYYKNKKEIADTHPREKMSTNLLDLKNYLDNDNSIEIKIDWTDTHSMIPIGLAKEVSTENLEINEITPEKITHSQKSQSKMKLEPGENLTINFPKSETNKQEETFLLKTKGYYEQI